ncbi:MAG: hypothetical protein JJU45_02300 [Acidimicrobiia bacterium]|nr:hypothetical protein [Acidimicrobiia bacterium]
MDVDSNEGDDGSPSGSEADDVAGIDDADHGLVDEHDPDAPPHPAAAAANWRTVLMVDGSMGVGALVLGVVVAFNWIPAVGAALASFGLAYVVLVIRRGRRWAAWRQRQGW